MCVGNQVITKGTFSGYEVPAPLKRTNTPRKIMRLTVEMQDALRGNPVSMALKRLGKNGTGAGLTNAYVEGQTMNYSPNLRELQKAYVENRLTDIMFPVKGLLRAEGV
jgi:hypothetical protein